MSDSADRPKPDGSAFKAHMEEVSARNDAARKTGRKEREERERSQSVSRYADDARQSADLRSGHSKRGGAASLIREKKKKG